jgi:hypothetical protein|tara:strand:- start:295 stop:525 length:231 start_codon:yes stop_codon:yes gene_type:complete
MKYKIKAEDFLGATSDLADEIMQKKYSQEEYEKLIQYEDKEKTCSYFTEDGQEIFNEILSDVEHILYRYGIIHEDA